MAKKYDTNPLDGEILQRAEVERNKTNDTRNAPTQFLEDETQNFANFNDTDFQTRRFADAPPVGNQNYPPPNYQSQPKQAEFYQSVYAPPPNSAHLKASQAGNLPNVVRPTSRKVEGLNLPEYVLVTLPYLPISPVAIIMAIITLLTVSRTESRVRFHAAQGLALHVAFLAISTALNFIGTFSNWAGLVGGIFWLTMFILFIIWSVKAWKGKPVHIEAVDGLTDWIEEKIATKK